MLTSFKTCIVVGSAFGSIDCFFENAPNLEQTQKGFYSIKKATNTQEPIYSTTTTIQYNINKNKCV